jgi:polyisoprenoid-binding protein YceI
MLKQLTRTTPGRVALGIAAVAVIAVIGAGTAAAIYVFGPGPTGSGHGKTPTPVPSLTAAANQVVYTIDGSATTASFTVDEVLFGAPNTVVGKTNQVTGQVLVNTQDPALSQIGQIRVDVSTLVTDNDLRNQTMQHRILETSDPANQYAVFAAKTLTGLPTTTAGHAYGDTFTFQATGDLTLHQVTRTVTFDIQLTIKSATLLTGHAQATVRYEDFGMAIPNVPSVSRVSSSVIIALDFTAKA